MGRVGRAYLLQQVNICPIGISTFKPVLHKNLGEPCLQLLSLRSEKKDLQFKENKCRNAFSDYFFNTGVAY